MADIQEWMSQRLKIISQSDFTHHLSHRTLRSKKNTQICQEFYSVPLASGCGTAILISPKNEATLTGEFGPLVILFHALGHDCTTPYLHWIYEFVDKGISVLTVDWDGHGIGASSMLDLQEATRSIPLILQRLYGEENGTGLNAKRNGPACFLMGHSFGASLALIAVTRQDVYKNIYGVIAVSPLLSLQSFFKTIKEFFGLLRPSVWFTDFANKFGFYGILGFFPPYCSFRRKKYPIRLKLDIDYLEQAREFVRETFENRRILRQVKTPVLWFHGLKDSLCPYYKACRFMLDIPSAFFSFSDDKRGHLRMIFSDKVMASSIKFIEKNTEYYSKRK